MQDLQGTLHRCQCIFIITLYYVTVRCSFFLWTIKNLYLTTLGYSKKKKKKKMKRDLASTFTLTLR